MKPEDIIKSLNDRIVYINDEIRYLYSVNPINAFPGSKETMNQYVNGVIQTLKEEKTFILKLKKEISPE